MTHPTIRAAREFANHHKLQGVLIVSFVNGQYCITTYGQTKQQCASLKPLNNFIADTINADRFDLGAMWL